MDLINRMKSGETLQGFYFNIGRREFFAVTDRKNKTSKLAGDIIAAMQRAGLPVHDSEQGRAVILRAIIPGRCAVKLCPACADLNTPERYYFNIYGANYSGYGAEDINDGSTLVFTV